MDVREVSADVPATTRAYQIDEGDTVDVGGDGLVGMAEEFVPDGIERIALTCPWIEHSENLRLIGEDGSPFADVADPTVYCTEPDRLRFGDTQWIERIEDGDRITLSGHAFRVIVVPLNYDEAMFYNPDSGTLFAGDVVSLLSDVDQDAVSPTTKDRLTELDSLAVREVYPAMMPGGRDAYGPGDLGEFLERIGV